MTNVLKNTAILWTKALEGIDARKRIFTGIRDMEYTISPWRVNVEEVLEEALGQALIDRKGFCLSKHYLLGELLRELEYGVKYCTYSFKWSETDINFPPDVIAITRRLPLTYHVACKVLISGKWILVDATWDKHLKKAGFPVNRWDGVSDTFLAVKPVEEFEHDSIGVHQFFYRKIMNAYSLKEKLTMARFTRKFNAWLAGIRMPKGGILKL